MVTGTTIYGNSTYGVDINAGAGASSTVTIKNAVITNNGQYGVYRNSGSGTTTATITYSDVWNNPSGNYFNASGGAGAERR